MWFEIQFRWLMSKTSRIEITVWPTETNKTLAMTNNNERMVKTQKNQQNTQWK